MPWLLARHVGAASRDDVTVSDIDVRCVTAANGWLCQVTVAQHGSESRHSVTLTRDDFQRLAGSGESPQSLVRRSFEFLLQREPKESILSAFELPVIGRYFPDFEATIRQGASRPG
jgi:hypothetical protein